jgi:hypothetical protein
MRWLSGEIQYDLQSKKNSAWQLTARAAASLAAIIFFP